MLSNNSLRQRHDLLINIIGGLAEVINSSVSPPTFSARCVDPSVHVESSSTILRSSSTCHLKSFVSFLVLKMFLCGNIVTNARLRLSFSLSRESPVQLWVRLPSSVQSDLWLQQTWLSQTREQVRLGSLVLLFLVLIDFIKTIFLSLC